MKRCPTCNRTFTEPNLSFCIDDGTPLAIVPEDDERTAVSPKSGSQSPQSQIPDLKSESYTPPAYRPPGAYVPPGKQRSSWPWVLGILAVVLIAIVGFGIAAAIIIPRLARSSGNRNRGVVISNQNDNEKSSNSNSNSNVSENANANANTNSGTENTSAPTDQAQVLSDLTSLEQDWTVANINADKKALERILADDYVGVTEGRAQGKAEYLRTIKRDTSIERWDFDDLKLNLKGDRATLNGTIKLIVSGTEVKMRFTDKFVWRDNRWQATGSEVSQIQ
jgi:hypothetical protein